MKEEDDTSGRMKTSIMKDFQIFVIFFECGRLLNYYILSIINCLIGQLNSQAFLYKKSSISTLSGDSLLRASRIKSPAAEKSSSEGTDVAGTHKYLVAIGKRGRRTLSFFAIRQNLSGSSSQC